MCPAVGVAPHTKDSDAQLSVNHHHLRTSWRRVFFGVNPMVVDIDHGKAVVGEFVVCHSISSMRTLTRIG